MGDNYYSIECKISYLDDKIMRRLVHRVFDSNFKRYITKQNKLLNSMFKVCL